MVYLFGIVWIMFGVVIFGGYLIITFIPVVPLLFKELFIYGKCNGELKTSVKKIEVPKRSFIYFYLIGAIVNGVMALLILYCYSQHIPFPSKLNSLLQYIKSNKQPSQLNSLTPVLLSLLMWFQNTRRFLECKYVSIYSASSINLLHFLLGVFFYSTFPILILSDTISPQFSKGSLKGQLRAHHIIGILIFFISSYHHYHVHLAFARLRTDKKGTTRTFKHLIPSGHFLFHYISSPHYLLEILIYASFCMLDAFQSFNLACLFFFVVCNQVASALMTHAWYKTNFAAYPSQRKAIIPFLL